MPPHSAEAEQSLLGGLLLDNRAYDKIADLITAEDFYRDDHRRIFRHIAKLVEQAKPADLVTVAESINTSEDRDRAGGPAYLGSLAQNTPSALNIRRYAELVRETAMRRELMARAGDMIEAASKNVEDPREIVERAETAILAIRGREMAEDVDLPLLLIETVDRADEARQGKAPRGLRTGLVDLDELLGGLMPGSLTILAGRTSTGKTALALTIASGVTEQEPVAFFSMEMSREEIAQRLLADRAAVPVHRIRDGQLSVDQVNALAASATEFGQRPLLLDDRPAVGVGYLRARCRRWKRKHGLGLVVVDYLQLMKAERGRGESTREQEVSSLSRGLKALAKELHVPVLALCQLNRALEGRADKRPALHDLRESGAIEQDADIVLMLYRDNLGGDETLNRGLAQVLVRKHRNGPLGDVTLRYVAPLCRFENTSDRFVAGSPAVRPVAGFRPGRAAVAEVP